MIAFPCAIVPGAERDYGFVIQFWLETSRPHYVGISSWKHAIRDGILEVIRTGKLVVAHAPEDRDLLYGFAVATDGTLRYVFVRPTRRNGGLGAALVKDTGAVKFAPGPRPGEAWAKRRGLNR